MTLSIGLLGCIIADQGFLGFIQFFDIVFWMVFTGCLTFKYYSRALTIYTYFQEWFLFYVQFRGQA